MSSSDEDREVVNEPDLEGRRVARDQAQSWLGSGEPLLAYNTTQEALASWPEDLRLRQLQALALARSGAVGRAAELLEALRAEGHEDGETLGLLGRTHKDLALSAADSAARRQHLASSFAIYEGAYRAAAARGEAAAAYYTGINAATLALLGDQVERAREIAAHVLELCRAEAAAGGGNYWLTATMGEAALILRDLRAARGHYAQAAREAAGRYADLSSTRRQARMLLTHLGEETTWLEETLAVPPVLVFSGHMVDHPERAEPRFPAAAEAAVRQRIGEYIARIRPVAAYGSAACGSDLLCLEAVLAEGGELHVVLPFPAAEFRRQSVDFAAGWGARFERVIEAASSIFVASDHCAEGSAAPFDYANRILTGMGALRAQVLETPLVGLAVWDGRDGDGVGGTADVVRLWRQRDMEVELIGPGEGATAEPPSAAVPAPPPQPVPGFSHEIKAMLFADAVGYSKMSENQIPIFVQHFLGAIAALNDRSSHRPVLMEVAGDGLYFVFEDSRDAGLYALDLSELVRRREWAACGLPAHLDMRVALHCGPVYRCVNPITKAVMCTGPHTSRTARIEPITPPGQVYASSAFAAVAVAEGVEELHFDYVGRTSLAKKYGALALFHVRSGRPRG